MSKYVGQIEFIGSSRLSRTTAVMEFGVMVDWFKSVVEYHRPMVNVGDYDGTEIVISVFEHIPDMDCDRLLDMVSIMNPYDI